jgi:hypothetical protein
MGIVDLITEKTRHSSTRYQHILHPEIKVSIGKYETTIVCDNDNAKALIAWTGLVVDVTWLSPEIVEHQEANPPTSLFEAWLDNPDVDSAYDPHERGHGNHTTHDSDLL